MDSKTRKTLTADLDGQIKIELKLFGASGFEWRPHYDKRAIKLVGRRNFVKEKRFGAAGKTVFFFRAKARGDIPIEFMLSRPFEEKPVQSKHFLIHVV